MFSNVMYFSAFPGVKHVTESIFSQKFNFNLKDRSFVILCSVHSFL
jgi:hypothetical protein